MRSHAIERVVVAVVVMVAQACVSENRRAGSPGDTAEAAPDDDLGSGGGDSDGVGDAVPEETGSGGDGGDVADGADGADGVSGERFLTYCMPCREHADCNVDPVSGGPADVHANRCLGGDDALGGRFCGTACADLPGACPDGAACVDGQCRPDDGVCRCSALAVAVAAETSCAVAAADDAICTGARRCERVGEVATACDASPPTEESCNGIDDDCDGATDERPLAPSCGDYACQGAAGCGTRCETTADCVPGLACDLGDSDGDLKTDECVATGEDGTVCALSVECASGFCSNERCCTVAGPDDDPLCCAEDADCAALEGATVCTDAGLEGCFGIKTVGRCEDSRCVAVSVPSSEGCVGEPCRSGLCAGGVFDAPHVCGGDGSCHESADVACEDGDPCTTDVCDAEEGCESKPYNGTTQTSCYSFDAATRGVGACHDGLVACKQGAVSGCEDEHGPADGETCNGIDDDCNGLTDDDTEGACFPYLCGGVIGCLLDCHGDADCAAGNFCDDRTCRGTGANGAQCDDDDECQSAHCSGGVCCEAGLCCRAKSDCASLDAARCDSATSAGCQGVRIVGVCGAQARCTTEETPDDTACDGEVCEAGACDGAQVVPAAVCAGALCVSEPARTCSPYGCAEGACLDRCGDDDDDDGDDDCVGGAVCIDHACQRLPDGAPCTSSDACASAHCDNGFCCAGSGTCCGGADADCASLDAAPICDEAATCQGTRNTGFCDEDFVCRTTSVSDPAGCLGVSCGGAQCVNLDGGGLVLEGLKEPRCDANGACSETIRDCRDPDGGECISNSGLAALTCENCSPSRTTCISFSSPCRCE